MPSKYRTMRPQERREFKKTTINLNDNTRITECHNGWWLWDETQGMNLSIKADSKEEEHLSLLAEGKAAEVNGNNSSCLTMQVCIFGGLDDEDKDDFDKDKEQFMVGSFVSGTSLPSLGLDSNNSAYSKNCST